MNIILLTTADFTGPDRVVLTDRRAEHIRTVLRAEAGRTLRVGMLDGPPGTGTVLAHDDRQVTLACRFAPAPPPPSGLTLLLALPRPKVLKRLWSPLAAFAPDEIIIVNARRVEKNYFATHWLTPAAYAPLLQTGLEQAGHTRLPRVRIVRRLRPLVADELAARAAVETLLMADPAGGDTPQLTAVPLAPRVVLAIGPEGGWVEDERNLLTGCGFRPVTLGPRPLRSDVACLAALGILTCRAAGV